MRTASETFQRLQYVFMYANLISHSGVEKNLSSLLAAFSIIQVNFYF